MSFDGDPERRVRGWPWWRVPLLGAGLIFMLILGVVLSIAVGDGVEIVSPFPRAVNELAALPMILAMYWVYARFVIGLPHAFFRIGRPTTAAMAWLAIGLGLAAIVLGVHGLAGHFTTVETDRSTGDVAVLIGSSLAVGLVIGVIEELVFRGYLLRLLEARWNPPVAIIGTAAIFAVLHHGHAPTPIALASVITTTFLAGVLLAVVARRTGDVWNAAFAHSGWNMLVVGNIVSIRPPGEPHSRAIVAYTIEAGVGIVPHGVPPAAGPVAVIVLIAAVGIVLTAETLPGTGHRD